MKQQTIKVLIVEDHPIYRMGLKELINSQMDMQVCDEADDVSAALKCMAETPPDMVVVDLALRSSNGLELIKEINTCKHPVPVLVLSMHDESIHAQRCIAAGARGYIMKQEASTSVVKAIRRILAGNSYVSPRVMTQLLNYMRNQNNSLPKSPIDSLSDRELEIFQWIGKGYSPSRIANQLNLSAKTIGAHKERIKEKLGLKDGGELVRFAVLWTANGGEMTR